MSNESLAEETVNTLLTEKLLTLTEARAELQTTTGRRHDEGNAVAMDHTRLPRQQA